MNHLADQRLGIPAPAEHSQRRLITFLIVLFVLGVVSQEFSLLDVGRYSVPLIYFVAIPFCLKTTLRSITFLALPLVSFVLAALVGFLAHVNPMAIASQAALQLLAILFAAGVASINWRQYLGTLAKWMAVVGTPTVLFGGYQMFARTYGWKYAFLPVTNQQDYADGGLQRGWEKHPFTRASSVFVEPSEFGYFCLWLMLLGLTAANARLRLLLIMLAFAGFMFSQSLSAALGSVVLLVCYVAVSSSTFSVVRQAAIILLISIMVIFSLQPLMPQAFDKFYDRIEQAVTLDNRADSGRVDHLPENWYMFKTAPMWGRGLASVSSADSNGIDVTTFAYFLLLIERGIMGTVFFMVPWVWLGWRAIQMPKTDTLRPACILFSALNLYTFSYSSMAYTPSYWLALGVCASCILRTYLPATQVMFANMEEAIPVGRGSFPLNAEHRSS